VLERRLLEFAESRGYRTLKQLDVEALREFRATWQYAPITAQKRLEHLRAFFRFCVDSDWLDKNPALAVKSGKVQHIPKAPLSDEEMTRILAACRRAPKNGKWGADMSTRARAMALLLRYSALRISDASVLERERLADDRIFIYTQKTGTPVWVPVPPFVSKALEKCPNRNPKFFFWSGVGKRTTAVNVWQETFQKVFERARVPNPHIHRFRHTFAVSLLQMGVSIEIVSVLLAHSSIRVTERHYSPWIKARQEQLEAAVKKTWQATRQSPRNCRGAALQ
jgi:integrase